MSSLKSRPTTTEESIKKSSQPSYKAEDKTKGSLSAEPKVFEREVKNGQPRDPLEQDQDSLYQQFSQDQMRHDPYDIQNKQASSLYQKHSKFFAEGSKKMAKMDQSSDMDDEESAELDQIESGLQSPLEHQADPQHRYREGNLIKDAGNIKVYSHESNLKQRMQ